MSNTNAPKKHILLATTGASPQVVTETLFAIHEQNLPWPEEIQIITTTFGKKKAEAGLFSEAHLQRMCEEIGKPVFQPEQVKILVVPDANGVEVEDARSLEDHEALANFITTKVRDLAADENNVIHASLAGGRKTMTFYLGYAMSLFGRSCDVLSHVLVSEPSYENLASFWYPSKIQAQLTDREHKPVYRKDDSPLMAADATVTLAEIPFIRHRHELPKVLANESKSDINFRRLVRLINLGDSPDQILLTVDLPNRKIIVSDKQDGTVLLDFEPNMLALAFYSLLVRATLKGDATLYRPSGDYAHVAGTVLRDAILEELLKIEEQPIKGEIGDNIEDNLKLLNCLNTRSADALKKPLKDTWFSQRRDELVDGLTRHLSVPVSNWLSPEVIWNEDGERVSNKTKGGGYGIQLPPENITLIEMPA